MTKYVDTPPSSPEHPRQSKHRDAASAALDKPNKWVVLEYPNHNTARQTATQIRNGYGTIGKIYAEFGRFTAQVRRSTEGDISYLYVRWLGEK